MRIKDRPSINVFNRQRKIVVDVEPLHEFLHEVSNLFGLQIPFSVVLVSDAVMKKHNRRYRGKNQPTDVLSFSNEKDGWELEPYLGDILISAETANRQKRRSLIEELKVLSLHGLLHLLGYDHETDQGEMKTLERDLKRRFKLP